MLRNQKGDQLCACDLLPLAPAIHYRRITGERALGLAVIVRDVRATSRPTSRLITGPEMNAMLHVINGATSYEGATLKTPTSYLDHHIISPIRAALPVASGMLQVSVDGRYLYQSLGEANPRFSTRKEGHISLPEGKLVSGALVVPGQNGSDVLVVAVALPGSKKNISLYTYPLRDGTPQGSGIKVDGFNAACDLPAQRFTDDPIFVGLGGDNQVIVDTGSAFQSTKLTPSSSMDGRFTALTTSTLKSQLRRSTQRCCFVSSKPGGSLLLVSAQGKDLVIDIPPNPFNSNKWRTSNTLHLSNGAIVDLVAAGPGSVLISAQAQKTQTLMLLDLTSRITKPVCEVSQALSAPSIFHKLSDGTEQVITAVTELPNKLAVYQRAPGDAFSLTKILPLQCSARSLMFHPSLECVVVTTDTALIELSPQQAKK